MANEITTTTADDLTYAAMILAGDVLDAFWGHNTAMPLVRFSSLAGMPSKAKDFPILPELAASSIVEGADLSNTAYVTTKATITAAEVGIMATLTDLQSMSDIVGDDVYAMSLGKAVAKKVTGDILALSAGFSQQCGATTVDLSEQNILDGITLLMAGGVPGPYRGILHPQQWNDLAAGVGATINPASTTGSESVEQVTQRFGAKPDGGLGNLYGVEWYLSSLVPTATAGADRSGMMVSPQHALGFVEKYPVRVEFERDASLRAREIVVTTAYGVGELQDAAGIQILTDA